MWEVIFRIGALRRLYLAEQIIENGALANYKFEKALRIVYTGDGEVRLSPAEFSIALHLFRNPGLPISKIDLFRLYAKGSEINTRRIDMIISRIRKKLRLGPASGAVIISIPNVGYRLSLMRPHNSAVSR